MYSIVNLIELRDGRVMREKRRKQLEDIPREKRHIIDIVMDGNGWWINIIYTSHLIKLN